MKDWRCLYSVLKMTREEKDNVPITDESYVKRINKNICIKDIERMPADEIKEGVINYLETVVPDFH